MNLNNFSENTKKILDETSKRLSTDIIKKGGFNQWKWLTENAPFCQIWINIKIGDYFWLETLPLWNNIQDNSEDGVEEVSIWVELSANAIANNLTLKFWIKTYPYWANIKSKGALFTEYNPIIDILQKYNVPPKLFYQWKAKFPKISKEYLISNVMRGNTQIQKYSMIGFQRSNVSYGPIKLIYDIPNNKIGELL